MRTCTVMTYYAGDTGEIVYAVMRGPFRRGTFYAHRADVVGRFAFVKGEPRLDYRTMTAAYATPAAPAVPWQA